MKIARSSRAFLLTMFLGLGHGVFGQEPPLLKVVVQEEMLSFELGSVSEDETWVLQHSPNGESWEDVIFLEQLVVGEDPAITIARKAVTGGRAKAGFFRAAKFAEENLQYATFLKSRVQWRTEGPASYTYVVQSNRGMVSSKTRYTVVDGETTMHEVISIEPSFFTAPSDRTIDDWFETVFYAIEWDAFVMDVTWDKDFGFPANGYIDLEEFLADEEQGWTITEFVPIL